MPSLPETIAVAMNEAARGRPEQAIEDLKRQLPLHPASAELHQAIGLLVMRRGEVDQGLYHFQRAAAAQPRADYLTNYATVLNLKGKYKEAAEQYRKAAALAPSYFAAHLGLASALIGLEDYIAAAESARRAVALGPARPEPYTNLAIALSRSGKSADAVRAAHEGLAQVRDHPMLLSVLVDVLHDRPEADPSQVYEEHRRLGRVLTQLHSGAMYPDFGAPDPDRALRIGYLFTEFAERPVADFLSCVLSRHETTSMVPTCYAGISSSDASLRRLRRACTSVVDTSRLSDDQLEQRIRADRIDILVEMSGHMPGSRIAALVRRLAPVQVSWLGYADTTGLKAIDARLADARTAPAGSEARSVEPIVRLDQGLCWEPANASPREATPRGPVTFGTLAPVARLSEECIRAWSRILDALAGSRLLVADRALQSAALRDDLAERFGASGIAKGRLEMSPGAAGALEKVDIGLDPFPRSSPKPLCEALSAGVPVVTLEGGTESARVGASILAAAGADRFIAGSVDDYVSKAVDLGSNPEALGAMRATLAAEVRASPLCDCGRFTRQLEATLRGLWLDWCKRAG